MASKPRKLLRLVIPVAAVIALLAVAASAYADATVDRIPVSGTVFLPINDTCLGQTGLATVQLQGTEQVVSTPTGFHAVGIVSGTVDVIYDDGSQAHGSFVNPAEFMFTSGVGEQTATSTNTSPVSAVLTVYDSNGQVLGTETVHWLVHESVTIDDGNPPIVHSFIDTSSTPLFTCGA